MLVDGSPLYPFDTGLGGRPGLNAQLFGESSHTKLNKDVQKNQKRNLLSRSPRIACSLGVCLFATSAHSAGDRRRDPHTGRDRARAARACAARRALRIVVSAALDGGTVCRCGALFCISLCAHARLRDWRGWSRRERSRSFAAWKCEEVEAYAVMGRAERVPQARPRGSMIALEHTFRRRVACAIAETAAGTRLGFLRGWLIARDSR